MSSTVNLRDKQVYLPDESARDAELVAAVLGESLEEFIDRAVRQAVKRDFPRAVEVVEERAAAYAKPAAA